MALHEDRNGCALHGALRLLDAVEGVVPILHANAGCGVSARAAGEAFAGGLGGLSTSSGETSATALLEKQVVFGGTSRLREQIKNTLKVLTGDLYVVVSGCVPEVVGDDVPAMVKEAREQRFPVLGIAAPGFKGNGWAGYASAARTLLEQLPAIAAPDDETRRFDVNLLGVVPGHDPGFEGDLLAVEAILAAAGLRVNRLVGLGQGVEAWRQAPRARASVVLSPWGLDAARLLAERHGTPIVDLGFVPVGSRDAALLLERVGEALSLDAAALEVARAALDARLRHFLRKAAPSLLLGDVQERVAVVGGAGAAVGQARFLAGTLGQLVEQVIVTDRPVAERREGIVEAVRAVAGPLADVRFLESRHEIARALAALSPELILGSALERPIARDLGAALVEAAAPLRGTPALRRSFAGVDGAVTLVEELLGAVRREREEAARPGGERVASTPTIASTACRAAAPERGVAAAVQSPDPPAPQLTRRTRMPTHKDVLYHELQQKAEIGQEGITFDPGIFQGLDVGGALQEQVHCLFEYDTDTHVGLELPPYLVLPNGLVTIFNYTRRSPNRLEHDGSRFFVVRRDGEAIPVEFAKRPRYYAKQTSDGTAMRTVAVHNTDGVVFVAYSNECSLKSTGKDCLFCNINATKDTYGEAEGVRWKYPRQIGETVAAAYAEGARHVTISGGFVPERREVDYYLDVAESIKEHTGLDDFNGTACIGAPQDLSIIEKYREVGYRTLAINIEVWNEHFFRAYCPGKEQLCGGQRHWIRALEHAVEVFGRGRVRSNMVGGLESKASTLEGIEQLTSKGIIAISPAWFPNPGSALEGHRSPEPAWHLDIAKRTVEIYRRVGFTWDQIYDANAAPITLVHDIYRIEEGRLAAGRETPASRRAKTSTADGVRVAP